jgi:hypothetical protein
MIRRIFSGSIFAGITGTMKAIALAGILTASSEAPAHALLLFTVRQEGSDVVVRGRSIGIVNTSTLGTSVGNVNNLLYFDGYLGQLGTGKGKLSISDPDPDNIVNLEGFTVTGPPDFGSSPDDGFAFGASNDPATQSIYLDAFNQVLYLPQGYNGYTIDSTTIFGGTDLATLGLARGSFDWTWGTASESETFRLEIDPVPGPLPALGASAAFAWSRRLRRRVRASQQPGS